jgi:hypothetical protein
LTVIAPGFLVRVQVPFGRLLRTMLPVGTEHVGCVTVPMCGVWGTDGTVLISTLSEAADVQPVSDVTVKVYLPGERFDIVVLVPEPVVSVPPGCIVRVQFPDEGRLFRMTLPEGSLHEGCVIAPITGAAGTFNGAFIVIPDEGSDVQPSALVTVKV